jgi:heme/copper-type cytochrome/quinol oxidase subunit 3
MQRELLEQQLSRKELQDLRNKRTGLFIFQLSWIMVFICLVIVNWQLRFSSTSWPPPGVEKLPMLIPTIATGLLLVSAFLARRATQAVKENRNSSFLSQWQVVIVLGAAFVVLMAFEWVTLPYSKTYSDVFRTMTGFHIIHALAIGAFMINIYQGARAGKYGQANFWPVEGATSLWYFVVVAWILFYVVLYWI